MKHCAKCFHASAESALGTRVCKRTQDSRLTWQERSGARPWMCGMQGRFFVSHEENEMKKQREKEAA